MIHRIKSNHFPKRRINESSRDAWSFIKTFEDVIKKLPFEVDYTDGMVFQAETNNLAKSWKYLVDNSSVNELEGEVGKFLECVSVNEKDSNAHIKFTCLYDKNNNEINLYITNGGRAAIEIVPSFDVFNFDLIMAMAGA